MMPEQWTGGGRVWSSSRATARQAGSRSIAPFQSALKATKRKIGFGPSAKGIEGGREANISVEKANTMTDMYCRRLLHPSLPPSLAKIESASLALMHLKRDFWPLAFQPPFFAPRSAVCLTHSGGEITSILSLLFWFVPSGSMTLDNVRPH